MRIMKNLKILWNDVMHGNACEWCADYGFRLCCSVVPSGGSEIVLGLT